jgi:CheY-like chemotaxis protein
VDDDPVFVDLMHELLALGEGYEVVSSTNHLCSLEFVKETQPDVLILDLMMGRDQAGPAVIELLRHDPATANVPILVCSAAAPALLRSACALRSRGAVETISKPFDIDEMLRLIEGLASTREPVAT